AAVLALHPPAEFPAGFAFVLLAIFLGLGTGSIFALVARLVEPSRVGTVTGQVGAAGGLGGDFPTLLMGRIYQVTCAYPLGLVLLAASCLAVALYSVRAFRGIP